MCKERMHRLVAEELGKGAGFAGGDWRGLMKRCYARMDEEVMEACSCGGPTPCVCEQASLVTDVVGSTAVVAVVAPDVVVVANCGDSRAVLCRSGRPVPLSTDHKVRAAPCLPTLFVERFLSPWSFCGGCHA